MGFGRSVGRHDGGTAPDTSGTRGDGSWMRQVMIMWDVAGGGCSADRIGSGRGRGNCFSGAKRGEQRHVSWSQPGRSLLLNSKYCRRVIRDGWVTAPLPLTAVRPAQSAQPARIARAVWICVNTSDVVAPWTGSDG